MTVEATAPPEGPERVALEATAGIALATGRRIVDPAALAAACAGRGLAGEAWFAAMEALRDRGLVQLRAGGPALVQLLAVTDAGLLTHLSATRDDPGEVAARIWRAAAAAPPGEPVALHEEVGEPALLVEVLLERWAGEGRALYSKAPGRRFRVFRLAPEGPPDPNW